VQELLLAAQLAADVPAMPKHYAAEAAAHAPLVVHTQYKSVAAHLQLAYPAAV